MSKRRKHSDGCPVCFDCKWIINDELKTPFYDTTFASLLPGDELIRCSDCNIVDLKPITVRSKAKKHSGWRYKTH